MKRRDFLKSLAGVVAGTVAIPTVVKDKEKLPEIKKHQRCNYRIFYRQHVFEIRPYRMTLNHWVKEIRLRRGDYTCVHLIEPEEFDDIVIRECIFNILIHRMNRKFYRKPEDGIYLDADEIQCCSCKRMLEVKKGFYVPGDKIECPCGNKVRFILNAEVAI